MIESTHLQANFEKLAVKRFSPEIGEISWGGIFLHGAGNSNKERGDALCQEMARRGVLTVSFDFSGCGESTNYSAGSIKKRVDEACIVVEQLLFPSEFPLVVLAFSMSGQVAIEMLRTFGKRIRCLALFNPAIYDKRAISVPFGPEFSEIIRRPLSWKNSDIDACFKGYLGKTLLVKSEHDDVIPPEVFDLIRAAVPANKFSVLEIKSASHQLGAFLNEHPQATENVADTILNLLNAA